MQLFQYIATALYALTLITYFFVEVKDDYNTRVTVKCTLVATFILFSITNAVIVKEFSLFSLLVNLALVANGIGDVVLVLKKGEHYFTRGAFCFFTGALLLFSAMLLRLITLSVSFASIWWGLLLIPALYLPFAILQLKGGFSFGKHKSLGNAYIISLTLVGAFGLCAALAGDTSLLLVGIGCVAFALSDYFLSMYHYKLRQPAILVTNSALYFSGMWLIALCSLFVLI